MSWAAKRSWMILVRARSWLCALPISNVVETMRPLAAEPIQGAPGFLRGFSMIRGEPLPVLHLGALLGGDPSKRGQRYLVLSAGARRFAVEVDEVVGVKSLPQGGLEEAPALLREALPTCVQKLGSLDGGVLTVLDTARILPDELVPLLDVGGAP